MLDHKLTTLIDKEDDGYVALCPELDIASEGKSIEEARTNLMEAVEGFIETASWEEILHRLERGSGYASPGNRSS